MAKTISRGLPPKSYTKVNEHYKIYGYDLVTGEPEYTMVATVMLDSCIRANYKMLKESYKKGLTGINFGV